MDNDAGATPRLSHWHSLTFVAASAGFGVIIAYTGLLGRGRRVYISLTG
jgi:hypothetical protein